MAYPQEFIVTLRNLKEDHRRLFDEHKTISRMLREALDDLAVLSANQVVLREDLSAIEGKLDGIGPSVDAIISSLSALGAKVDSLERKLDEVVALIREIRAL